MDYGPRSGRAAKSSLPDAPAQLVGVAAHYEVRSWIGWHHHVTLSILALAFLTLERRRLGNRRLH